MPSRINSTTTSPGGLITTGDSDNSLLIQTGDTTAITVNSSQVVSLAQPLPVASGGTGVTSNAAAPFALKGANTDITSLGNLTTALSISQGGTGATTATAAFNALNPMTTAGDMLYESSPTVATRLPIGSTGQILTVSGGIPTWAAAPSSTPTTAQVLSATAGATAGDIGTYAFLGQTDTTSRTFGATLAGSSLRTASIGAGANWNSSTDGVQARAGSTGASSVSGTWRLMGNNRVFDSGCATYYPASLWLRIS